MFNGIFLVPTYYKNFKCKCGACENICCSLWTITLNQKEYFQLMNLKVSTSLKEKIDTYIGILPHPNVNEYARINLDYNGFCPLRNKEGLCALQYETSEQDIPSVCRYYPRSPKLFPRKECVISSSCERTIELLLEDKNKFSLEEMELSFYFDDDENANVEKKEDLNIRSKCLNIIANRNINIISRIKELILYLDPNFDFNPKQDEEIFFQIKEIYSRSLSINSYLLKCNQLLNLDTIYNKLCTIYPDLSFYLEKIISNHFYYMKFPYIDSLSFNDVSYALYFLILLTLNLLLSNNYTSKRDFISLICNSFRLYEHSSFYYNIAVLRHNYLNENITR